LSRSNCTIKTLVHINIKKSIKAPEDIKVSDRSFKRGKAPDVDPKYLRIDVQEERLKTDEVNEKIVGGRAPWLEWSTTK